MISSPSGRSSDISILNRGIVLVHARERYAKWANRVDPGRIPYEDMGGWVHAYLIPEFDLAEESWEWIRENCSTIFEIELNEWHSDPDTWPEDRTWKTFRKWFEIELIDLAWDLLETPLLGRPPPISGGLD